MTEPYIAELSASVAVIVGLFYEGRIMSVKRYEMKTKYRGHESWDELEEDKEGGYVDYEDYSALEQKLTDMAVQLANSESKCRELAAREVELPTFNIPVRWGRVMICVDMTEIKKRCVDAIRAAGIGVKGE